MVNEREMNKDKKRYLAVNCAECAATVRAEVMTIHETSYFDQQVMLTLPDNRIALVICPSGHPILAQETWQGEDDEGVSTWSRPARLWPQPERASNALIPDIARISLEEANRCHRAGAYTASAVMCGRALEGICGHF